MGTRHTLPKGLMTGALATGPIMLLYGLGVLDDVPPALIKANHGTGPDKGEWGANFFGISRQSLLLCIGICKIAALADIWVLHIMPKVTCLCVATMLMMITYVHFEIGDDIFPPFLLGFMAYYTCATWPDPASKKPKKQ